MKKILTVLVVFGLGAAVGGMFDGAPPRAEAAGGRGGGVEKCAAKNGDVNADGNVDLSDAVTILGNLFLGNPTELVPLCEPPELPARIQELEAQLASSQADLATCHGDLQRSTEATTALTTQVNQLQTQLADCRAGN